MIERFKTAPKYILDNVIKETYRKKESIFVQGDKTEYMYFISKGIVEVSTMSPNGQKLSISFYEKGGSLGVLELLDTESQTQNVTALTDCELVKVHKDYILKWMKNDFEFNLYVFGLLQECFDEASYFSRTLILHNLRDRVILSLHKHFTKSTLRHLTKDILIQETGSQRRSLNRIIKDLFEEGLVDYNNKVFTIIDDKKLQLLVNEII